MSGQAEMDAIAEYRRRHTDMGQPPQPLTVHRVVDDNVAVLRSLEQNQTGPYHHKDLEVTGPR